MGAEYRRWWVWRRSEGWLVEAGDSGTTVGVGWESEGGLKEGRGFLGIAEFQRYDGLMARRPGFPYLSFVLRPPYPLRGDSPGTRHRLTSLEPGVSGRTTSGAP